MLKEDGGPYWDRVVDGATGQISLVPFTKVLIAWDFHVDIVDDRNSDVGLETIVLKRAMAPNPNLAAFSLSPLKHTYSSDRDYINHYLGIFLVETKQSMYRAKEMDMTETCGEIVSKISVVPKGNDGTFIFTVERRR